MEPKEHADECPPDDSHFPDCPAQHVDGVCTCDVIERDMRDAFKAMTRECY